LLFQAGYWQPVHLVVSLLNGRNVHERCCRHGSSLDGKIKMPRTAKLKIEVRPAYVTAMLRDARARFMSLNNYVAQVIESHAAGLTLKTIEPSPLPTKELSASTPNGKPGRCGTSFWMSPEEIQRALFLRETQGLTVACIATRLNRSERAIQRALLQRDGAQRVPVSRARRKRGSDWCKNLPLRKIPEAQT
jgi:hypothetical protein